MSCRDHFLALVLLAALPTAAQTQVPGSADEQLQVPAVLDAVQGGWLVSGTGETRAHNEQMKDSRDPDVRNGLDQFRIERNASLARNMGDLPNSDQQRLVQMATSINVSAPNSFEAHLSNFYVQYPSPSAFQELDLASLKGKDREELIAPRLNDALRKNNAEELSTWAKAMRARGRVAPGLYRMAEDVLASLEPDAVIITAGEMDAYPVLVEQYANGKRKDVLVVDERLLGDLAYRTRIWERVKGNGNVPLATGFIPALAQGTARPVFLSLALGEATMKPLKDHLYVTGLAIRVSMVPIDNIPILEERWGRLKKAMDAGPLSRNYLLPGSILLKYYRSSGDEARAARLEFELREMGRQLGATTTLIKSGVLSH